MDKREHLCVRCELKNACKYYKDIKESPIGTIYKCPNYKKPSKGGGNNEIM